MFCTGLIQLRKSALPLALAVVILAGTSVVLSSTTAGRDHVRVEFERRLARSRQNM